MSELSVLPMNTTQCPQPGLEPGPLAAELSALTRRPPCLPMTIRIWLDVVQSLNSPFFPPHIGAERGRAKEESRDESRITCMRMLRTPSFFPPKSKTIFGNIFQIWLVARFSEFSEQATISAFRLIKNMSINPKSVEFHQCHAKPHSICSLSQKKTKEIFAKIC